MSFNNDVKTSMNLDRETTLELEGSPRSGHRIKAKLTKVDDSNPTIIELSLSDETVRNLIHVLEGYR